MSILVESLKRLFLNDEITEKRLEEMVHKSITKEEFEYITSKQPVYSQNVPNTKEA